MENKEIANVAVPVDRRRNKDLAEQMSIGLPFERANGMFILQMFKLFRLWPMYFLNLITHQGFFSKFLMGGTQNFRSPLVPDGDEVGWGGGTCKKNSTEAITAHLMQN